MFPAARASRRSLGVVRAPLAPPGPGYADDALLDPYTAVAAIAASAPALEHWHGSRIGPTSTRTAPAAPTRSARPDDETVSGAGVSADIRPGRLVIPATNLWDEIDGVTLQVVVVVRSQIRCRGSQSCARLEPGRRLWFQPRFRGDRRQAAIAPPSGEGRRHRQQPSGPDECGAPMTSVR